MNAKFYINYHLSEQATSGSSNVEIAKNSFMKMVTRWTPKEINDALTVASHKFNVDWDELYSHIEKDLESEDNE